MNELYLPVETADPRLFPFTETRPKFTLPIANTPLLLRQIAAALTDRSTRLVLLTPPDHVEAVKSLIAALPAAQRKRVSARCGDSDKPSAGAGRVFTPPDWLNIVYPWHILTASWRCLKEMRVKPARGTKCDIHKSARIEGAVAIGRNVTIESGAVLKGPLVIGDSAVILSGVYIDGPCLIGSRCHLGPHCHIQESCLGTECHVEQNMSVVRSVFFEHVIFGHFGYVGHSVCAENSGGGGGTVLFDTPFGSQSVKVVIQGAAIDTGLHKLGPLVGARVTSGASAVFLPGIILGPNSAVGPGAVADRNLAASQTMFNKQNVVFETRAKPQH